MMEQSNTVLVMFDHDYGWIVETNNDGEFEMDQQSMLQSLRPCPSHSTKAARTDAILRGVAMCQSEAAPHTLLVYGEGCVARINVASSQERT